MVGNIVYALWLINKLKNWVSTNYFFYRRCLLFFSFLSTLFFYIQESLIDYNPNLSSRLPLLYLFVKHPTEHFPELCWELNFLLVLDH